MGFFLNGSSNIVIDDMIGIIKENKQYLGDIDGAIGDGDHGINMNKGFTLCETELKETPGNLTHSLFVLSKVLMGDIGGSMGPLYGMFFKSMAVASEGREKIDERMFGDMLFAAQESVRKIGCAEEGDKTLLDSLMPAVRAYRESLESGADFSAALNAMRQAARSGMESTRGMVAKVGRASRLGERSRGHIDAGSASCCLILVSMADSIIKLLKEIR